MNDYDSSLWNTFLAADATDASMGAVIAHAIEESAANRQRAAQVGDTAAALVFANRLVKLGFAQARWVGEQSAGDIQMIRDDIAAHSSLYELAGFVTGTTSRILTYLVVGLVVYAIARRKGWL